MGMLDGRIAIITGAGGGLGRAYALAMAAEGAKIVVNDLGGRRDGTEGGHSMADAVVEEIRKAGGEAVASYDSVADADGAMKIVQAALESFGRLDVLVNNAGILRDRTLLKTEDEDWRAVLAVHLDGTFYCGRAAARYMKEHEVSGRIINTTSFSGLIGNFGQSNYGAAKAGIAGLTRVWAKELAKYGITVNAVAPMAKTRMTDDIESVPDDMTPEMVSPMVVYLASDRAADVNGRIFGVHGRHYFEYKMSMTEGVRKEADWTASEVAEKIETIAAEAAAAAAGAAAGGSVADRIRAAFTLMEKAFTPEKAGDWKANLHFLIDGADDHSVQVEGGKVEIRTGTHGAPTCKVQVSAATLVEMIEGKLSGQQAFMAGKIKADNLQDLMRYGKVFDFERARKAAGAAPAAAAAGAGPASLGDRIRSAFQLMEKAFVPENAAGWKANLQFLIAGADDHTIVVEDGKVAIQTGTHGTPTCKVQIAAETLADMIEGKLSGQQAFMAGKIKADNLQDLMRFGKVFDFKRARAAAEARPAEPSIDVAAAFGKLPEVFLAEKAGGWNGKVAFEVEGTDGWTVEVRDRKCAVSSGKDKEPTCVITAAPGVLADWFAGKLDVSEARSSGKLKASNPMALVKFNQFFEWGSPKLAAPAAAAAGGLNRKLVGKKYRAPAVFVRAENIRAYAEATDDPNPRFRAQENPVAPPVFPVTLIRGLFGEVLSDDIGGDLSRMVHGGQTIRFHGLLHPWDLISPRGTVAEIEDKESGQILHVDQSLYREGEPVVEMRTSLFYRDGEARESKPAAAKPAAPSAEKTDFSRTVTVADDQTYRYAEASGDNNPIHVNPDAAKAVGLPGIILHGLCTMAFAGQAIVEECLGGDPGRLAELSVRFSRPVLPGDTLTTRGRYEDEETIAFTTVNQSGVEVLSKGVARIR